MIQFLQYAFQIVMNCNLRLVGGFIIRIAFLFFLGLLFINSNTESPEIVFLLLLRALYHQKEQKGGVAADVQSPMSSLKVKVICKWFYFKFSWQSNETEAN